MTANTAREEYISLLKSTGRSGIDSVVDYLDKAGFSRLRLLLTAI